EFMSEQAVRIHSQLEGELEKIKMETNAKVVTAASKVEAKIDLLDKAVGHGLTEAHELLMRRATNLKAEAQKIMDMHLSDFQVLMKNAYLDEYEKMRKN